MIVHPTFLKNTSFQHVFAIVCMDHLKLCLNYHRRAFVSFVFNIHGYHQKTCRLVFQHLAIFVTFLGWLSDLYVMRFFIYIYIYHPSPSHDNIGIIY